LILFVDEIHLIAEDGRGHRNDLLNLKNNLFKHVQPKTRMLGATATMTWRSYQALETDVGFRFEKALWGLMNRREIYIRFEPVATSNKMKRITEVLEKFLRRHPEKKAVVHCNFALAVKDKI
jgi:superfamily II DNA helicase RecQ